MNEYVYNIRSDYHQFYIQDDDMNFGDLSNAWSDIAVNNHITTAERTIGIGTHIDETVLVKIYICKIDPEINMANYDQITKAGLYTETGRLVIAGCTDHFPTAARIGVSPGFYTAVIGCNGLNELNGIDREQYEIFLFPGKYETATCVKSYIRA